MSSGELADQAYGHTMTQRGKGLVFDRDGSKYEVVSQELPVLYCILQYYSALSDVMFDILAYVETAFVLTMMGITKS
jgi:hypothetical protein